MRVLFEIDTKDYTEFDSLFIRPSSRAIIIENKKIAMVYSKKYDYYKFPGGGIEKNESPIDAVIRETKEEAGIIINKNNIEEYGIVKRKEKIEDNKVFVQDNYYYFIKSYDAISNQNLDEYEKEEGFTLIFVDPLKAISTNKFNNHGITNQIMLDRDALVLELLIYEGYFK
jgi:8-oxo-dGTP pyrophosphatase MutT (NUDIX family)